METDFKKKIQRWIRIYNERIGVLISIALFFFIQPILRAFDPTAGFFDAGILQVIILVIIFLNVGSSLCWYLLKWNFRPFFDSLNDIIDKDNGTLYGANQKKVVLALIIYAFYMISFILIIHAIL
ncbi:MAG: hypothetical protein AAF363_15765 [Bacteroidota bacterium]